MADGALSQVTNLLNRAVTLATEASNGTLNSSQEAAANQEYQSILSEINNIGSTTTYNQQKVFGGADTSIYTGDSSSQSASVDSLHFSSVSSSSVGDAGGTVNYSSGNSVFLNLSSATVNSQSTDAIAAGSSLSVQYKNADGTTGTATITPTTDTVNGLVDAINNAGLGFTATFTTAGAAGDTSATSTSQTGVQISGALNITALSTSSDLIAQGTTAVTDTTTTAGALQAGSTGIATISYSDTNGQHANLSSTSLTSQANAQTALTTLNSAITDLAAQDGYIGAQINTLNSVSQVISTQQQNIVAAQNAVQATDYAQASSNLSKYEILSQTGISALAQSNSLQQEVTKLLQ